MGVAFELTGDKELDRKFQTLPERVQKKCLRPGLREGAKVVNARAKADTPKVTGAARESLKVRAAKRSRTNANLVTMRAITAAGWFKGKSYYLGFREFGFQAGSRKAYRVGKGTYHKLGYRWLAARVPVKGKHTIEKAAEAVGSQALAVATERIKRDIEAEAAK